MKDDWWNNPKTGEVVDFIDFCRSEGRFGKHFDREGNPSELLEMAREERLENWHQLQELAGLLGSGNKQEKKVAAKPAAAKPKSSNGDSLPKGLSIGSRIKYNDGERWVDGVLRSDDPVVLALDDNTKIEISQSLLRNAVDIGIVRPQ